MGCFYTTIYVLFIGSYNNFFNPAVPPAVLCCSVLLLALCNNGILWRTSLLILAGTLRAQYQRTAACGVCMCNVCTVCGRSSGKSTIPTHRSVFGANSKLYSGPTKHPPPASWSSFACMYSHSESTSFIKYLNIYSGRILMRRATKASSHCDAARRIIRLDGELSMATFYCNNYIIQDVSIMGYISSVSFVSIRSVWPAFLLYIVFTCLAITQ